ncbi:MAG: DUF1302 domain-containing protein, partial [Marinobacter sp.]|nr:DUF1302 domain-containing protein [Marinobacter sp.]
MQTKINGLSLWCAALYGTTALTLAAISSTAAAEDTRVNGFYENATYAREGVGLSKFRNTIQLEGEKRFGNVGIFSNVSVNGTLRGSYDGVYDLNDDEYGSEAGGPIRLQDIAQGTVPHGGGIAPTPFLGFDINQNPNEAMEVLGERLHGQDNGVAFGVPVRP